MLQGSQEGNGALSQQRCLQRVLTSQLPEHCQGCKPHLLLAAAAHAYQRRQGTCSSSQNLIKALC